MYDFGMMFLSAERRKQIAEQEKAYIQRCLKHSINWDEDKTKFAKQLLLHGDTFDTTRYRVFDSKPATAADLRTYQAATAEKILSHMTNVVVSPQQNFVYANRLLPAAEKLELMQGHRKGWVAFDTDVLTPVLFQLHPGSYDPVSVWMGVTPMEILTQRAGVRAAKGHVLLGGLGLGWMLHKVAAKKSVTKITVVELSQELLDWYGTDLCQRVAAEYNKPVEVICGDVLEHMGKHGPDVRHLVDIWPSYPNYVEDLSKPWQDAIKRVKHFWGWGVLAEPSNSSW